MFKNNTEFTNKQIKFCYEYLKDFNGTKAAIRAGYAKNSANEQAARMLAKDSIQSFIKELNGKIEKKDIMDIQEIQERLTSMARGETSEEVVVTENVGDFTSVAKVLSKKVSAKEQVKALELLGKANALFVDKVDASIKNENQELLKKYLEDVKNGKLKKEKETEGD